MQQQSEFNSVKTGMQYGHSYEFLLTDGRIVRGVAGDSCIMSPSAFDKNRQDIDWSKFVGYRHVGAVNG